MGFSLADHTLPTRPEPAWKKWLNPPLVASHGLWTARREAEVQPRTDNDQKKREGLLVNISDGTLSGLHSHGHSVGGTD